MVCLLWFCPRRAGMFTNGNFLIIVPFGSILGRFGGFTVGQGARPCAPTDGIIPGQAATRAAPTMNAVAASPRLEVIVHGGDGLSSLARGKGVVTRHLIDSLADYSPCLARPVGIKSYFASGLTSAVSPFACCHLLIVGLPGVSLAIGSS